MQKNTRLLLFLLIALVIPALCQASITVLTSASPDHTISSGSDEQLKKA